MPLGAAATRMLHAAAMRHPARHQLLPSHRGSLPCRLSNQYATHVSVASTFAESIQMTVGQGRCLGKTAITVLGRRGSKE